MGATAATRLESLTVAPISLISGEVELPGSKSLSNRVLLLSALAEVRNEPIDRALLMVLPCYAVGYAVGFSLDGGRGFRAFHIHTCTSFSLPLGALLCCV